MSDGTTSVGGNNREVPPGCVRETAVLCVHEVCAFCEDPPPTKYCNAMGAQLAMCSCVLKGFKFVRKGLSKCGVVCAGAQDEGCALGTQGAR